MASVQSKRFGEVQKMTWMVCLALAIMGQPAQAAGMLSPGRTTYYVDSRSGSDENSGNSPAKAWKTLSRVNATLFAPGDKILLKAGSVWNNEQLFPKGSGSSQSPIIVDTYGGDPKPIINCNGAHLAAVLLYNQEYWELRNLEITNTGPTRVPDRKGVYIHVNNYGTAHHIHLRNLFVHDINGSNVKKEGGGWGILFHNDGPYKKTRFDDVLIENCHLARTDRSGISISNWPDYWQRTDWYPNLNVVIRGNLLEDIGGDGIVPIGCDGCLVEYNILRGGRQRAQDAAAGIWPWSCDNTVLQFNEVSGMKGTHDGQAYDSDSNCRNTVFQYNYSHDNEGGFLLVCNDSSQVMPVGIGNVGTVFRYNVSQNDGEFHSGPTFELSGSITNTKIYNNVIYIGKHLDIRLVNVWNWKGGWADNTNFYNNIFYVDGNARYYFGGITNTVFSNNVFYGNHQDPPNDPNAITADPMLVSPGSGARGLDSLKGYTLKAGSPCIGAGRTISDNGGRDFWGNQLEKNKAPDIGAHQLPR